MDKSGAQTKGPIDPSGEAIYVEVFRKPVFDKDHEDQQFDP